jgi:hypothetical protein
LISRLIGAVTEPGDLIVDPAAGSFIVLTAALQLGRNFIGCDLIVPPDLKVDIPHRAEYGGVPGGVHVTLGRV